MIDITIPDGNENELAEMAEKLGYDAICFLYRDKIIKFDASIDSFPGTIGRKGNERGLINVVQTLEGRKALEKLPGDVVIGLEGQQRMDFMHHRNAGLNQVLCKIAKSKRKAIGYSLKDIMSAKRGHQLIGRISQNIKLCRKYGVTQVIGSFATRPMEMRAPKDILSLFEEFGMHPKEASDALCAASEIVKQNLSKRDPRYVAKGVYYLGSKK